MIAKAVKGRGFRGALEYDLGKDHARVIDSNMTGNSLRELAAEFGEIRKLRPGLNKAVLHVSLSAAPGEHLTDRQWIDIARRYLQGMDLEQNQYVLTRHLDTDHEHVHLLANRIRFNGTVTSDSHDYRRQEALMRRIEHDLGLRQVALSRDCERRAASKGEIEEGLRTGCASTRQQLQQLCDAAMAECTGFAAYASRLMAVGVELVPVTQLEGTKLSGLSYRLDGVTMKGSDLGKRYSPAGLSKHGVDYDKERDFETVSRCLERGAPGQPRATASDATCSPDRERGAAGIVAGAAGAGDGRADGGITRDVGGCRAALPGAGGELAEPGRCGDGGLKPNIDNRAAGSERHGLSGSQNGVALLPAGGVDRPDEWSARERILALASPVCHGRSTERKGTTGASQSQDATRAAIERQIVALGCRQFELLLRDVNNGELKQCEWDFDQVLENVPWLKRMNARGHSIFVRPSGKHGFAFLSGLVEDNLLKMARDGLTPSASVEIASGEFEAWVKMAHRVLPEHLRYIAKLDLVGSLSIADKNTASDGYCVLADFIHHGIVRDGIWRQNHVLSHAGSAQVRSKATSWLDFARTKLEPESESFQYCEATLRPLSKLKSRARSR